MKYLFIAFLLLSSMAMATERQGPDYYEFFVDKKLENKDEQPLTKLSNTQIVAELKRVHEEALNASILNPTKENILHERMLAVIYMDLAQKYQERAQMVVASNPQINYTLRHPVDDAARKQHDAIDDHKRDDRIKALTKTHGLFFFYAGACRHCKAFAPTIKRFASRYGFEIIPISLDGEKLPEFPNSKKDNGQAENLGLKSLPAVFAIDPSKGPQQSMLLSYGNVSVLELADKLDYNYRYLTGQVQYEILK